MEPTKINLVMIHDNFRNIMKYSNIPYVQEIKDFLLSCDINKLANGSYEIYKKELILNKSEYMLKDITNLKFESHIKYADLHFVLFGKEAIMTVFPESAKTIAAYNTDNDTEFFSAEQNVSTSYLIPGTFLFLAPGEIHKPAGQCPDYSDKIIKCVIKIHYPF
ncbi:MAG: YhcH/YjgK/YiaL family protein [Methanomicrobiaceae archaeon]|nr:YhcH/YjgK/YiaL family protein [Methanomicrobiaceae archaeon]